MAMALDTLAYARRLREAGFTEQQAEGQAEALAAAMTDTLANKQDLLALATKQDLADVSAGMSVRIETLNREIEALRHDMELRFERVDARFAQVDARIDGLARQMDVRFAELEARFDSKLADLERRMTMRLGAIMVAGIGFLSAVVQLG